VAFACSLNGPVEWRTARTGQRNVGRLIGQLGFNMPPSLNAASATPPSTAAVRGLVSGSPRRVHQMSAAILAALSGRGDKAVTAPTLVAKYDFTSPENREAFEARPRHGIVPDKLIKPGARNMVRRFLSAPLCYRANNRPHGTLKSLDDWCASRRKGLALHFGKTGTAVTGNEHATIDAWATGGLRFSNRAAYSYVVVVGTGSAAQPFADRLHSSQLAAPLLRTLLSDLESNARANPPPPPPRPATAPPLANRSNGRGKLDVAEVSGNGTDASAGTRRRSFVDELLQQPRLDAN